MIEAAPNLMHRTILMLLYGTGMRRTEASLVKVSDIDSERMVIHIQQGKGSRDRDVLLTPKLLEALREYWRWKKPKVYLFPSTEGHRGLEQPISDRTVWYVCRAAAKRAGIKKRIGPHTLRHSFATHLLEAGTDLRTIQLLMGHAQLEDTTMYLHLSQRHLHAAINPLDQITLRQPVPEAAGQLSGMSRPPLEVADVVRKAGNRFRRTLSRRRLTWPQLKVLNAIARCRTAALGGHRDQCARCGHQAISYNSCRNRHCPKCQTNARERWLAPGVSRNCCRSATFTWSSACRTHSYR